MLAAALALAIVGSGAATTAYALGGPVTHSGITGRSWVSGSTPCNPSPATCAYSISNVGPTSLSVQLTSGGVLTGPKITTTGSPATINRVGSLYIPGARHWGNGDTFTT